MECFSFYFINLIIRNWNKRIRAGLGANCYDYDKNKGTTRVISLIGQLHLRWLWEQGRGTTRSKSLPSAPGPSLKMRTRRVSFTWNHFLRPVHSLGLRWIGLFKARYQMRSSTSTARTLHTSLKERAGWPKGSINWDFSLSLFSHWILLIPLWNRNNNNKKMAHAGASINAAPLVVSSDEAVDVLSLVTFPRSLV